MIGEWVYHPGSHIAGLLIRVTGGAQVHGLEHAPREGPFILVANHCSQVDPPLLGWAVGHQIDRVVHFMAKEEMREWPVIGWLADRAGVFFVRRGEGDRAAQRTALGLLAAGRPIAIFPEGTRSRDGVLKDFKPGAALLALRSGAPVLPVGVAGTHRIFPGGTRMPHRSPVTIRIGPTFVAGHVPTGRLDRHRLADTTRRMSEAVATLLPPGQRPRETHPPLGPFEPEALRP